MRDWTEVIFSARPFALVIAAELLLFSCAADPCSASATADWPMFRGNPSLTGLASGSLENKLTLLWSFKTEKPVKSSPAIVGNRVYVGSDDGRLYAIDFAKGIKLWDFKTEGTVESSPLVMGNRVYVGSSD